MHRGLLCNYMECENNPNLLRALAEEGNSIGSHTNRHRALVAQTGDYGTTLPMTDEEYEKIFPLPTKNWPSP